MERIAVLVASNPGTPAAGRAFQLVRDLSAQGHQITLVLLEDAVVGSTGRLSEVPLEQSTAVMVLAEDLALRGIDLAGLHPACRSCTYAEIIDQVMVKNDRTLGAF
ncbi:MAG: DsrH/TusB family sulfur metabolism protein [Symbiobacteriia bacterium]